MDRDIEIRNKSGHYEIYVNGIFYSSCDSGELSEELDIIDRDKLLSEFDNFKTLHDVEIERIKNSDNRLISSMGI